MNLIAESSRQASSHLRPIVSSRTGMRSFKQRRRACPQQVLFKNIGGSFGTPTCLRSSVMSIYLLNSSSISSSSSFLLEFSGFKNSVMGQACFISEFLPPFVGSACSGCTGNVNENLLPLAFEKSTFQLMAFESIFAILRLMSTLDSSMFLNSVYCTTLLILKLSFLSRSNLEFSTSTLTLGVEF